MMLVDSLKDPVPSDRCTSQEQIHVAVATYVVLSLLSKLKEFKAQSCLSAKTDHNKTTWWLD